MPVDAAALRDLLRHPEVRVEPRAHAAEHSIEVELPFLQHRLADFSVVPLVVGEIGTDRLAAILETLWGGDETLIVVSTDLTHFLPAEQAERTDLATAHAIERTEGAALTGVEACGHRPLVGLARLRGAPRHAADAARADAFGRGRRRQGAGRRLWRLDGARAEAARLSPAHRAAALRLAGEALLHRARPWPWPGAVALQGFPAPLQSVGAAFVTLTREGRLRGCIGSLGAVRPLAEDIAVNAAKAGFEDPRFRPGDRGRAGGLEIELAILSRPAPMAIRDEADLLAQLRPGRDGLILQDGGRRGTFLPKVWDALPEPGDFLAALKAKAGLPRDHWSGEVKVWRYVAESFKGPMPAR